MPKQSNHPRMPAQAITSGSRSTGTGWKWRGSAPVSGGYVRRRPERRPKTSPPAHARALDTYADDPDAGPRGSSPVSASCHVREGWWRPRPLPDSVTRPAPSPVATHWSQPRAVTRFRGFTCLVAGPFEAFTGQVAGCRVVCR
jgi:hypothetical protein